ncbi:hypothetical protein MA16_Dca000478 [Dendrobium catenatum]|uniref:Uncharacterized protein n=1 Tax=Dendrobium catenatum TaxID=906689 RepID=A0A2I0WTZ3_9ASPA|nr:hypothetical protein MA16_Dca000478 [Dendrobium catenatum]
MAPLLTSPRQPRQRRPANLSISPFHRRRDGNCAHLPLHFAQVLDINTLFSVESRRGNGHITACEVLLFPKPVHRLLLDVKAGVLTNFTGRRLPLPQRQR